MAITEPKEDYQACPLKHMLVVWIAGQEHPNIQIPSRVETQ